MIIIAGNMITGDGVTKLAQSGVFVDGEGKIGDIGRAEELRQRYPNEQMVSYPSGTLLPGLIDLHAHLGHWGCRPPMPLMNDYMMAYITQHHAQKALSRGVTSLRDVGSPEGAAMTMAAAAARGFFDIPRMQYCGSALCISGGHGSSFGLGEGVEETDGVDAIRKAVRNRIKHGSRWIKIMTSHRSDLCEYRMEELCAAVEEAHRLGAKAAVHSGTQPSIGMCIEAGFDTIEHATFVTKAQMEQMIEKHIAWTPTILPYTTIYLNMKKLYPEEAAAPREYFYCKAAADMYRDHFKEYYDMGVLIGAGTDHITQTGETDTDVARELEYMVEYGISPLEAICIGTMNGAKVLGMEEVGQLKKGLLADLLVVEGDPGTDITDLRNVREVFLGGKSVYCSE